MPMSIKILFFGYLADVAGAHEKDIQNTHDTDSFRQMLIVDFPKMNERPFAIAVNKEIINANTNLNDGDVVALLPPFAGG
jgi:molybdopterin synthase sulfur carrier subunit